MEIKDILDTRLMILDLKSRTKQEVLKELIEPLVRHGIVKDEESFFITVMAREGLSTTGIGMAIAIPHGKSETVMKPSVVFGKSMNGIDYDALDGEPSYIFFLIAVPDESDHEHLSLLSQLSRKLIHKEVRKKLMAVTSGEEVIEVFR